jgi:hypothetical protein
VAARLQDPAPLPLPPSPFVPVAHLESEGDGLEAGRVAAKLEDPASPFTLFPIVPVAHLECKGD